MKSIQRGFIIPLLVAAVAVILGWRALQTTMNTVTNTATTTATSQATSTDTTTWKTVSAPGNIASFKYPSDWTLKGVTLSSSQGDIVIKGSYIKGGMPACDPVNCTTESVSGIPYTRTMATSTTNTQIIYTASKFGFAGTATATISHDAHEQDNIALVDEIVNTITIK